MTYLCSPFALELREMLRSKRRVVMVAAMVTAAFDRTHSDEHGD